MYRKHANQILVLAFLLALGLPLLTAHFGPIVSSTEAMSQDWAQPGMDGWSRWRLGFGHEFGGREWLLGLERRLKVDVLGMSPSEEVIVGQHGWLFLGRYHGYDGLADFLRTRPMDENELARWTAHFVAKQAALQVRGIRYCVVFAPNKPTVYPEEMPAGLTPCPRPGRLDTMVGALHQVGIKVLNLAPALSGNKSTEPVYYRTDTHWNGAGAAVAYRTVMNFLGARALPAVPGGTEGTFEGNLAIISGLPQAFPETGTNPSYLPQHPEVSGSLQWGRAHGIDTAHPTPHAWVEDAVLANSQPSAALDTALLIGDSFLHYGFGPLVTQNYRHTEQIFSHTLDLQQVDRLHPQLVIEEMVEQDLSLPIMPPLLP